MSTRSDTGRDLAGRTVRSSDGERIGTVDDFHADESGAARYIEVKTGWFGTKRHAIPVESVSLDGDDVVIPYSKEQVKAAPTLDEHEHLNYDRERQMGGHYGYEVRDWDDKRDAWLDRDLTRGPTPETRRVMAGSGDPGADDARSHDPDIASDEPDIYSVMRVRYRRMGNP